MGKQEIRKTIRAARRELTASQRAEKSAQMCRQLTALDEFQAAGAVAGFLAFDGEADPMAAMKTASEQGKAVFVPMIVGPGKPLRFAAWTPAGPTRLNRFGILEPDVATSDWIEARELDFVINPLVGFNEAGDRLGVGGGYYDRTFSSPNMSPQEVGRIYRVGFAFELQKTAELVPEPWDVRLDCVVTESTIYR